MHEFSICQSLVDAVVAETRKSTPGVVKILKTRVVVGGLRQVVPDQLQLAYQCLTEGTLAEGSVLEVEIVPVAGRCKACNWSGTLTPPDFRCGACFSGEIALEKGRELYLASVEVETP
jgi:hydrogenase nickel incorporation protein HypA/HybF